MTKQYRQVTRKDVARLAGVSETVVSYVLNNNRYVDKEKRRRVEEAIRELDYRPNTIARALKGKSTNHIVFIADNIATEHFSLLISELDQCAYDLGYMVSLCSNRNSQKFVSDIISRRYDGIIISSISFPNEYIQQLIDARIPVVLLAGRDYSGVRGAGLIHNGLYEGARAAVRYLVRKGRRDILYIDRYSSGGYFSDLGDLRYRGFCEEMEAQGLDPRERIVTGCADPYELALAVEGYLGGNRVDAIFGRNDRVACIAMQAAQELGRRVPEDIAVVGFDNSTMSRYTTPPITSVEIGREGIAKSAVEMLRQMIERQEVPQPVTYPTLLIERASTLW